MQRAPRLQTAFETPPPLSPTRPPPHTRCIRQCTKPPQCSRGLPSPRHAGPPQLDSTRSLTRRSGRLPDNPHVTLLRGIHACTHHVIEGVHRLVPQSTAVVGPATVNRRLVTLIFRPEGVVNGQRRRPKMLRRSQRTQAAQHRRRRRAADHAARSFRGRPPPHPRRRQRHKRQ
jgi:hypothetical protein